MQLNVFSRSCVMYQLIICASFGDSLMHSLSLKEHILRVCSEASPTDYS